MEALMANLWHIRTINTALAVRIGAPLTSSTNRATNNRLKTHPKTKLEFELWVYLVAAETKSSNNQLEWPIRDD